MLSFERAKASFRDLPDEARTQAIAYAEGYATLCHSQQLLFFLPAAARKLSSKTGLFRLPQATNVSHDLLLDHGLWYAVREKWLFADRLDGPMNVRLPEPTPGKSQRNFVQNCDRDTHFLECETESDVARQNFDYLNCELTRWWTAYPNDSMVSSLVFGLSKDVRFFAKKQRSKTVRSELVTAVGGTLSRLFFSLALAGRMREANTLRVKSIRKYEDLYEAATYTDHDEVHWTVCAPVVTRWQSDASLFKKLQPPFRVYAPGLTGPDRYEPRTRDKRRRFLMK